MADHIVTEEWRPVVGYEGLYDVSSLGKVKARPRIWFAGRSGKSRRYKPEQIIQPSASKTNHQSIAVCRNGKKRRCLVHRLVAEAFLGPPPTPKHQVNHIDGNPCNNAVYNLEWCTHTENVRHGRRCLGSARGEKHHMAKLTEDDVLQIRGMLVEGYSIGILAEHFGVTKNTIAGINQRLSWRYLDGYAHQPPIRTRSPTINNRPRGSINNQAKLTEHQVAQIKNMLSNGYSLNVIAKRFSVSKKTISNIKHNRVWKHVKP